MPTVRLTAFFKDDDGHGWSEAHDKDGGSSITSLTTFLTNFNNLMQTRRRPMLGGDAFYLGCRASYKTNDGTVAGDNIELDPPMRGVQTVGGEVVNMTAPEVAVKMRFRNDASTARSDAYTRGEWKQVIDAGVLDLLSPLGAEWKTRADQYAAALIAGGYGWVGVNPTATPRGKVTGYTENLDGTVTINITSTNGIAIPVAGTKVTVKFARINASKSILNRLVVATVEPGAASVTTIERIATSAFVTDGTFIIYVKGFIPYAAMSYYRLSRRKTGRPFGVGPGRLSAQTLH
jgi:hypothetical protein